MKFVSRLALLLCAALVVPYAMKYFIFGTADFLPHNERMGEWKKATIRETCFTATEAPHLDSLLPKRPTEEHHIGWRDLKRAIEMTAALNCYLVTHPDAICEPNNRAYIVDYISRYLAKSKEMLDSAKQYGESEAQIVRTLWDSQRNRAISAALTSNINSGRLIKADFGWIPPSELKTKLDQYKGATNNCPKI